jgi:hypothetical protein
MALNNLTSVGGDINIGYNPVLTSLNGLDNIDAGTILGLFIYNNVSLSDCEVASICEFLSSPAGTVYVSDNAPGCNTPEEIEQGCLLISFDLTREDGALSLYPNPSPGYINIETPSSMNKCLVALLDVSGQELARYELTGTKSQISIADLPAGVYFVRVINDRSLITKKILKL